MGLLYCAGFQTTGSSGTGYMQAVVAGSTATIATGYYLPCDIGTSDFQSSPGVAYAGPAYTAFTTAIKTAFDTATSSTFTVTWSNSTGKYTISRATTFTLAFSTTAELRLRDALGFTGNKSGANTYTSDVVPAYICDSAIAGRTNVVGHYEPDDIADEAISDGGEAFVITRKTGELLMSWQQSMEPRSSVYEWAAYAASAYNVPWSWQQWFRHTRGSHPFWCIDALEGEPEGVLYRLTAKGASFRPQRVTADFDDQWIVPFEARWLARYIP
jgi:hypothetical protein